MIINVERGPIIDKEALVDALKMVTSRVPVVEPLPKKVQKWTMFY